jgi:hypothetical protein
VTVIFGFVCKAVKGISKTGTEFTSDVVPTRQLIIDADLNAGVVSESQALGLRAKITRETRFFVTMGGAAKFILCDAVIELVIVIVNIVFSMAMAVAESTSTEMSPKIYVTLAVGAGMVTQISVLITAVASDYLARKSLARSASDDGFLEHRRAGTERIKVAANEVVSPQKAELQYGRSVIPVNNIAVVESRFIESQLAEINDTAPTISFEPDEKVIAEDLGWFDESRHICGDDKKDDASLWVCREINDGSCYELIAELLESKSTDEIKTILMAADSVAELPVTMPVNIAMRLAQKNKKCLLIDLDLERGAISKVFDIDNKAPGDNVQAKAIATCIGNLWVWPASNFNRGDGSLDTTGMKDVIAALGSRYDRLIVYAPNIKSLAHWKQVAGSINLAMLFGDPESEIEGHCICSFHRLLISCGCEVLKPAEIFAEAV